MNEKNTILVLEDEIALSDVICAKFAEHGLNTVSARSVSQALNYLEEIPNITGIWMDHYLLGQDDGLVLVSKIKSENSQKKDIPIFVVSNTASDSKMHAYINLGVSKYIVKADSALSDIVGEMCDVLGVCGVERGGVHVPLGVAENVVKTQTVVPESKPLEQETQTVSSSAKTVVSSQTQQDSNVSKKILIIEDEEVLRKVMVETFEAANDSYEVFEAGDGEQGYEVALRERPDAIVLDVEMPRLDGIGFLKKLKISGVKNYKPYVLVLSNSSNIYDTMHALKYGVMDYLIKADNPLSVVVERVEEKLGE